EATAATTREIADRQPRARELLGDRSGRALEQRDELVGAVVIAIGPLEPDVLRGLDLAAVEEPAGVVAADRDAAEAARPGERCGDGTRRSGPRLRCVTRRRASPTVVHARARSDGRGAGERS